MIISILNSFLKEYCEAREYAKNKKITIENCNYKSFKNLPKQLKKVGYIVATCSPATKAHIELANKAIKDLNLDVLYFIIWPFHYIEGFHSSNMLQWIKKQKHYDWDIRVTLLEKAIINSNNKKIKILYETKDWYVESEKEFNNNDMYSYFWTGSWYVVRKLQAYINMFHREGMKR